LEQQIAEQKVLMGQLEAASGEEKKEILARLRKLGEEMKKSAETTTTTATTGPAPIIATTPSTSTTPAPNSAKRGTSMPAEDRERIIREKLDRELEMHNAALLAESETKEPKAEHGESMDELKAKLENLKAEAASLGISEPTSPGPVGGGYRGWYRGRGRGARSYYRGGPSMRGGPPRASMKLDNRPKKLLIKDAKEEHMQTVREWYNVSFCHYL
jgi:RNA-binding protein 26